MDKKVPEIKRSRLRYSLSKPFFTVPLKMESYVRKVYFEIMSSCIISNVSIAYSGTTRNKNLPSGE